MKRNSRREFLKASLLSLPFIYEGMSLARADEIFLKEYFADNRSRLDKVLEFIQEGMQKLIDARFNPSS